MIVLYQFLQWIECGLPGHSIVDYGQELSWQETDIKIYCHFWKYAIHLRKTRMISWLRHGTFANIYLWNVWSFYQPDQNVSIDERMVKNKGRYSFRQYIRDKSTKWGMKLWVLADSRSGYTFNFDIYLGKSDKILKFGLAYDVVMNLRKVLSNQGYHLYFDNFLTSSKLLKDLLVVGSMHVVQCSAIVLVIHSSWRI